MVSTSRNIQRSSWSRVWVLENRAGPANVPSYEGFARAGIPTLPVGELNNIYVPDPNQYGQFQVAGSFIGDRGSPTLPITNRYPADALSLFLKLARLGCDHDIQVHMGECQNPQDFNFGWEKVLVLEAARPSEWATTELGALGPGDEGAVDEEVPFVGQVMYEVGRVMFDEQAATEVVQEVVDVKVCDRVTCGSCGIPSEGCDVVFALTLTAGGSPGLPAEIVFTEDGGDNYSDTNITTLAANEDPNELACVGVNLVVISEDSESLHYAPIVDILAGTETWTEVATGFVVTNGPLAIYSLSPRHTWIVAENGFIYFTADPTSGVSVQDAGIATTENLNDVHAYDQNDIVAVGENNAVVVSSNGGETWQAITGPNVGVVLNTVWMRSPTEWFVGDAGGQLWYTRDSGANWTEKTFPFSGAGVIHDIAFSTPTVGWLSHATATPAGNILRTIDGGQSWYVAPENNTSLPANDRINALGVCEDANTVYGGGLADDAADGIIVKGASS